MPRIFKSFQVKIDQDQKTQIPTSAPPPRPRPPTQEEKDLAEFREIPLEALTGSRGSSLNDPSASKGETSADKVGSQPGFPNPPTSTEGLPSSNPATLSGAAAGARAATLIASANRRWAELTALEDRLREWETTLVERENILATTENETNTHMSSKRQHLEQEAQKFQELAKKNSDSMTTTARSEADSILKAARLEAENLKQKSQKEGYSIGEEKGIAAGEKSGLEEGRLEWQSLIQETEMIITELQTSRMALLKNSEEEMVRIVMAMVRKIIKVESLCRSDLILHNIDAAINRVSEVDKIVLRINLKDKSMAMTHKDRFLQRLSGVKELTILEDPSLSPGGVRIETGVATIDASLEAQADELEKAILKILKRPE